MLEMKIKFIKDWNNRYAGEVTDVDPNLAYRLIRKGLAVPCPRVPERMVDESPEKESR